MRHLALAAALVLWAGAAAAAPVREVVSFGDSLSDGGTYGFRSTTMPSLSWTQMVAQHFGHRQEPNEQAPFADIGKGVAGRPGRAGLDYAQGGARAAIGDQANPDGVPIPGTVQLRRFLAQHHRFRDDQLVTVWLGTNDLLIPVLVDAMQGGPAAEATAKERLRPGVLEAARAVAILTRQILDSGAPRVAVLNLFDLGNTPMPMTPASAATLTALVGDFNAELARTLPRDPRVVPVDAHAFFAGLTAQPEKHGFRHPVREDACTTGPTSPDCYQPAAWRAADAPDSYIFIGGVHFTRRTNELLARHVLEKLGEKP